MSASPGTELAVSEDVAWLRVTESSASGMVRRRAAEIAERVGFDEGAVGEVAIVATELSTNLVKYATDGTVVLRALRSDHSAGLAIVAVDHGPGIRDMTPLFADGESTSGTLGIGLGAVRRLASSYDAHSVAGRGTVVSATFWQGQPAAEPAAGLARAARGRGGVRRRLRHAPDRARAADDAQRRPRPRHARRAGVHGVCRGSSGTPSWSRRPSCSS